VGTKRIKPGKARTGHLTRMSPTSTEDRRWKRGEASLPRLLLGRITQAIGWRTVISYANQPGNADQLTQVERQGSGKVVFHEGIKSSFTETPAHSIIN